MNELDFFADNRFEKYLNDGEQVVWSGGARPLLQSADWLPSLWFTAAGVPPFMIAFTAFSLPNEGLATIGILLGGITIWLWAAAALRPIRMIKHLQEVRYALTNQRALIVNGVVYGNNYPLVRDSIELRAVSIEDLSQRIGPDENGTLTFAMIDVVRLLNREHRCIGFYACDEVEGAEIEILRLRGELPVAEKRDFDEILPEASHSPLGLEVARHRRKNLP